MVSTLQHQWKVWYRGGFALALQCLRVQSPPTASYQLACRGCFSTHVGCSRQDSLRGDFPCFHWVLSPSLFLSSPSLPLASQKTHEPSARMRRFFFCCLWQKKKRFSTKAKLQKNLAGKSFYCILGEGYTLQDCHGTLFLQALHFLFGFYKKSSWEPNRVDTRHNAIVFEVLLHPRHYHHPLIRKKEVVAFILLIQEFQMVQLLSIDLI